MPRPCKNRRICSIPFCKKFIPQDSMYADSAITMTMDEFECIRLIDFEGLRQEECAKRMAVARTTVQSIYSNARKKIAQSLVLGHELIIDGGDYILCPQSNYCPGSLYIKNTLPNLVKGVDIMKIAVTYENGQIFQHFGHTEQFKIYEIKDGKIVKSEIVDTLGSGHGALAGFLANLGIDVLICGGIGGGAKNALSQAGIQIYGGVYGLADTAVNALINNKLDFNPNVQCSHHEHSSNHSCGEHGCGSHSCSHN